MSKRSSRRRARRLAVRKAPASELLHAPIAIDTRAANVEARTVPAVLSNGAPVERYWGTERLKIEPGAIDLARAKRGLPLLFTHNHQQPIGRVDQVQIADGELRGVLRFGRSARAEEAWQDVLDGILSDVSIGYRVHEWKETTKGDRTAIKWELFEASVVAVPADPGARIERDDDPTPTPSSAEELASRNAALAGVFRAFPAHGDLLITCLERGDTPEQARAALLERLATATGEPQSGHGTVTAVADAADKAREGITRAIDVLYPAEPVAAAREPGQAGSQRTPELARRCAQILAEHKRAHEDAHANPYAGMDTLDLFRHYLADVHGARDALRWSRSMLADAIVSGRVAPAQRALVGHGPSDFTNLLSNNIGKQVLVGYTEAPETWQQWVRTGTLRDMRVENRPVLSTFSDLDDITAEQEYEYGTFSDKMETITAKRFGKLFSISRTALLNDDQNAFSEIPRHMGRAANRMVGDEVYTRLTANANMAEDSVALFHTATHNNLITTGAGAPGVSALNAMLADMATQTDPGSNVLNLRPAYILIPWALWGTTRTLLVSEHDSTNMERNVWQAALEQVTEARLDADSATAWYLAANPRSVGTVEASFVGGMQTPYLEQQEVLTRDGLVFKVRLEFGTAVLDWRGLSKNNGA